MTQGRSLTLVRVGKGSPHKASMQDRLPGVPGSWQVKIKGLLTGFASRSSLLDVGL